MYSGLSVDHIGIAYVSVSGRCIVSGNKVCLALPREGWDKYISGEYVQNAFPSISSDEREFLISGIGPGEFENFIGNEEE